MSFGSGVSVQSPVAVKGLLSSFISSLAESGGSDLVSVNGVQTVQDRFYNLSIMPEDFGAVGDGVANDYAALKSMCESISAAGRSVKIQMAQGATYFIDEYIVSGNGIVDPFRIDDIKNLVIDMNGAKIKVKGDFLRDVNSTRSVRGITLFDCENVLLCNGEIDGSVDLMTISGGVSEASNHGLYLAGCRNVLVSNLESHHFASDGLYINVRGNAVDGYKNNSRITLNNVISHSNGRQGMSVLGDMSLTCNGCEFSYSGYTGAGYGQTTGTYGGHSPRAGVDVEPDLKDPNSATPLGSLLVFNNSIFRGNQNYQFLCFINTRVTNLRLTACLIDARKTDGGYNNGQYNFVACAKNAIIDGCTIYGNYSEVTNSLPDNTGDLLIKNNTFYAADNVTAANNYGIGNIQSNNRVRIVGNKFKWISTLAPSGAGTAGFPKPTGSASHDVFEFEDNEIYISPWVHPKITTGGGSIDNFPLFKPTNLTKLKNNSFSVSPQFDCIFAGGWRFESGTIAEWSGNFYRCLTTGIAGLTPPTHTSGTASDGALDWEYLPEMTGNMHFYTLTSGSFEITQERYPDDKFRPYSNAVGYEKVFSQNRVDAMQGLKVCNSNMTKNAGILSGDGVPVAAPDASYNRALYMRFDGAVGSFLYLWDGSAWGAIA